MLLDIQNLIKTVYYSPHISIFARDQERNLLFSSQITKNLQLDSKTYTMLVLCDYIKIPSN
jgi:hypothetical protein